MENHTWRGNVRELRNAVERSMIMADSNVLSVERFRPNSVTMREWPQTVP